MRGDRKSALRPWLAALAIAIIVLAVDQASKQAATSLLAPGESVEALGGLISLTHASNPGLIVGLFADQISCFGVLAVLLLVWMIIYYRQGGLIRSRLIQASLGLQLGGALGNLLDRLRLGHVVDFLDLKFGLIMNLADLSILLGSGLIMLFLVLPGSRRYLSRREPLPGQRQG